MERMYLLIPARSPDDIVNGRLFQAAQRSQPVYRYAILSAQLPDTERKQFIVLHEGSPASYSYLCEVKDMITDEPHETYLCIVDSMQNFGYNVITFVKVYMVYRITCCR